MKINRNFTVKFLIFSLGIASLDQTMADSSLNSILPPQGVWLGSGTAPPSPDSVQWDIGSTLVVKCFAYGGDNRSEGTVLYPSNLKILSRSANRENGDKNFAVSIKPSFAVYNNLNHFVGTYNFPETSGKAYVEDPGVYFKLDLKLRSSQANINIGEVESADDNISNEMLTSLSKNITYTSRLVCQVAYAPPPPPSAVSLTMTSKTSANLSFYMPPSGAVAVRIDLELNKNPDCTKGTLLIPNPDLNQLAQDNRPVIIPYTNLKKTTMYYVSVCSVSGGISRALTNQVYTSFVSDSTSAGVPLGPNLNGFQFAPVLPSVPLMIPPNITLPPSH